MGIGIQSSVRFARNLWRIDGGSHIDPLNISLPSKSHPLCLICVNARVYPPPGKFVLPSVRNNATSYSGPKACPRILVTYCIAPRSDETNWKFVWAASI